jgi:hypothetical protein
MPELCQLWCSFGFYPAAMAEAMRAVYVVASPDSSGKGMLSARVQAILDGAGAFPVCAGRPQKINSSESFRVPFPT